MRRNYKKKFGMICISVNSIPPTTIPLFVKNISRYFPNLLELSLITVLALPKASIRGFTCKIRSSRVLLAACKNRKCRTCIPINLRKKALPCGIVQINSIRTIVWGQDLEKRCDFFFKWWNNFLKSIYISIKNKII